MSICRQAIAKRRKARIDPRYRKQKVFDAATSARRLHAKIQRELDRQLRSRKKK